MNGPNGKMAPVPAGCSLLAWALSLTSSSMCSFVSRSVAFTGDRIGGTEQVTINNEGIGFWGWVSNGTCYSYEINNHSPSFDALFATASALTTITDALGGLVVVCCGLGVMFPMAPKQYQMMGYCTALVAILDAMTLIVMASSACNPAFFDYATETIELEAVTESSCGMGIGSILAVVASALWFACAACILTTDLSQKKRTASHETTEEAQQFAQGTDEFDPTAGFQTGGEEAYEDQFDGGGNYYDPERNRAMQQPFVRDPNSRYPAGLYRADQHEDEYGDEQYEQYEQQQQQYDHYGHDQQQNYEYYENGNGEQQYDQYNQHDQYESGQIQPQNDVSRHYPPDRPLEGSFRSGPPRSAHNRGSFQASQRGSFQASHRGSLQASHRGSFQQHSILPTAAHDSYDDHFHDNYGEIDNSRRGSFNPAHNVSERSYFSDTDQDDDRWQDDGQGAFPEESYGNEDYEQNLLPERDSRYSDDDFASDPLA